MPQQVPLTSPIKGVVRAVPREGQPQDTCWNALNCLPYDRYGRKRLSQRTGLAYQFTNAAAGFIQGMIEAPSIIYPPGTTGSTVGGLSSLPGFAVPSSPGVVGPIANPVPAYVGVLNEWAWTFSLGSSMSTTPSNSDWSVDDGGTTDAYIYGNGAGLVVMAYTPFGADPVNDLLVFFLQTSNLLTSESGSASGISVNVYITNDGDLSGDPTHPGITYLASWYAQQNSPFGTNSVSQSADVTITLTGSGASSKVAITKNSYSGTGGASQYVSDDVAPTSIGVTQMYFPNMNLGGMSVGAIENEVNCSGTVASHAFSD